MKDEKQAPDWDQIELDYRAGVKSLRQIASEQNVSEGAIRKRSKRDEWSRDLSKKIQAKADDLVRKETVRSEVRTKTTISEKDTIDANANVVASIRITHRKDISRARSISMKLFDELELMVGAENVNLLQQLGELLINGLILVVMILTSQRLNRRQQVTYVVHTFRVRVQNWAVRGLQTFSRIPVQ